MDAVSLYTTLQLIIKQSFKDKLIRKVGQSFRDGGVVYNIDAVSMYNIATTYQLSELFLARFIQERGKREVYRLLVY